jgi:hypothetical protein
MRAPGRDENGFSPVSLQQDVRGTPDVEFSHFLRGCGTGVLVKIIRASGFRNEQRYRTLNYGRTSRRIYLYLISGSFRRQPFAERRGLSGPLTVVAGLPTMDLHSG